MPLSSCCFVREAERSKKNGVDAKVGLSSAEAILMGYSGRWARREESKAGGLFVARVEGWEMQEGIKSSSPVEL